MAIMIKKRLLKTSEEVNFAFYKELLKGYRMFRKYFSIALLLALHSANVKADENYLNVGIEPKNDAVLVAEKWIPILQDLSDLMGVALRFKTAPDVLSFNRSLSDGEYDLIISSFYLNTIFTAKYHLEEVGKLKLKGNNEALVLIGNNQQLSKNNHQRVIVGISKDNQHNDLSSILDHFDKLHQQFILVAFENDSQVIEAVQEGLQDYGIVNYDEKIYAATEWDGFKMYGLNDENETFYLSAKPELSQNLLNRLRNVLVSIEKKTHWTSVHGISHSDVISGKFLAYNMSIELRP